jgi:hypothetical protein
MKNLITIGLLLMNLYVFGQDKSDLSRCEEDSIDGLPIHLTVDNPPEYGGGLAGFYQDFSKNIKFPKSDKDLQFLTTFYISFVIDTTGDIRNFCSTDNIEFDEGFISKINKWTPGSFKDKSVPVRLKLPIHIRFE